MNIPRTPAILLIVWAVFVCGIVDSAWAQKKPPKKKLPSQQFKGFGLPEGVKTLPEEIPDVSSVSIQAREYVRDAAAKIDYLVGTQLAKAGLHPNAMADDYTLVRRIFLDTVGSIPTLGQTIAFANQSGSEKTEVLIDELLSSYGYVSHMYNYWAAILRVVDRPDNNILGYPYRDWLKEQLCENRPYDKWVYEMLTAEGKIWENPAVGYTLRDTGMELVHVDNTVRVFLGTQIGCAQCHDHPFDKWTQQEFYELAAFTHSTITRDNNNSPAFANGNPINRLREELKKGDEKNTLTGSKQRVALANLFRVSDDSRRKLKLPHDFKYGTPNQLVKAKVLWGEIPEAAKDLLPRYQFAAWLTSPENELFAKTLANRLWKKVMGVGLIEPVDDLREDSPCQNSELLEFLTAELIRLEFNQKEFLRMLMYTKTYQRKSSDFDPSAAEFFYFPGPRLRRMTAEQLWDSILAISIYNPYAVSIPGPEIFKNNVELDMAMVTTQQLEQAAAKFDAELSPSAINKQLNTVAYRRQMLVRASELPSPLPADHFIRQFGQCDRETIEGDSLDPTVPQVLTMFNGPFTHMILEKGSVIHDSLLRARTPKEALDIMFLSVLNRPPSNRDEDVGLHEIRRGDVAMGYGNVLWALLNTREFIFVR
ncbi:MAG: DUF1553 domain-containing protein [Planctomycetales bacterium]|nr:DUF1553 domain-containing protein [Planctomycetales bacterium]